MITVINKEESFNTKNKKLTNMFFYKGCFYVLHPEEKNIVVYKHNKMEGVISGSFYKLGAVNEKKQEIYLLKNKDNHHLYVMNNQFKFLRKLEIREDLSQVISLTCDETSDKILFATRKRLFSYDKENSFSEPFGFEDNSSISCLAIIDNQRWIGYFKEGKTYLALLSDKGEVMEKTFIEEGININALYKEEDVMKMVVNTVDNKNMLYSLTQEKKSCYDCENEEYYECNNDCDGKQTQDVITSIALVESAISHILNAEGEKIQKVIALSDDVKDLIKVNDSVCKLVSKVTMLEHVLLEKLQLALSGDSKEDDCDTIYEK